MKNSNIKLKLTQTGVLGFWGFGVLRAAVSAFA
jgi:hypothetical protein